jgi:competence protein ComEC
VAALWSSLEPAHPLRAGARPHTLCEAGQTWRWDGVEFRVLHPRADDYVGAATKKPNTLSCVLSITDRDGRRALLTGDLEADQELRLVREQPAALRADVLLVPHHGSRTSSTPEFIDAVAPRVALVQAGYRNRFGHPAPDVVVRYAERGIVLRDSVHCGAWRTWSDRSLARCEREAGRRYWHHGLEVARPASLEEQEEMPWRSTSR